MNWKRCGRKRSWPNFKVLYQHLSLVTEESTKDFSQYSRSPARDSNLGPPEYEAGVTIQVHIESVILY
jgi:hypothetical protein